MEVSTTNAKSRRIQSKMTPTPTKTARTIVPVDMEKEVVSLCLNIKV